MGKKVLGTSLLLAFILAGCTSPQMHQSLLIHENRQLENALYMAQAQAEELKRENDWLRSKQETNDVELPKKTDSRLIDEEFDLAPPIEIEMPKVILPSQPGTTEIPDSLKGAEVIPLWHPKR